jgi:hypothetical protein
MEFAIVDFVKTREVAIIPTNWISDGDMTKCWWPPFKLSDRIMKAVTRREIVDRNLWQSHDIVIRKHYGE